MHHFSAEFTCETSRKTDTYTSCGNEGAGRAFAPGVSTKGAPKQVPNYSVARARGEEGRKHVNMPPGAINPRYAHCTTDLIQLKLQAYNCHITY
jgi:hypothetical protein